MEMPKNLVIYCIVHHVGYQETHPSVTLQDEFESFPIGKERSSQQPNLTNQKNRLKDQTLLNF